jgi:hypothetical protein
MARKKFRNPDADEAERSKHATFFIRAVPFGDELYRSTLRLSRLSFSTVIIRKRI